MHLTSPTTTVPSKAVGLFYIICWGSFFGLRFVMHNYMCFLVPNRHGEEERAGCFAIFVFLMSCDCKCFVALPHGAAGWSAVSDCGIS